MRRRRGTPPSYTCSISLLVVSDCARTQKGGRKYRPAELPCLAPATPSRESLSLVPHQEPGAPKAAYPHALRDRSPAPSEDATVPKLPKFLNAAVALRKGASAGQGTTQRKAPLASTLPLERRAGTRCRTAGRRVKADELAPERGTPTELPDQPIGAPPYPAICVG